MRAAILILIAGLLVPCSASIADDDDAPKPRTIAVTGRAELRFPPDHVLVSVGLVSNSEDPEEAQATVSKRSATLIAFLRENGVEAKDLGTGYVRLEEAPREPGDDRRRKSDEPPKYRATTAVRVVIRDLSAYDRLLSGMLDAGANRIYGIAFDSEQRVAKAKEARILAVRAAREKAAYLAAELDQAVGPPLEVEEVVGRDVFSRSLAQSNVAVEESGGDLSGPSVAPEQLTIASEFSVVFELVAK